MTNAHMAHSGEDLQPQGVELENPFPNKYHFDEFASFEGERRLRSILRKILPMALYRTWEIFAAAQAQGNDCYLGLVKASEEAERVQKTIRQNILEFQARKLLVLRHEEKLLRQSDGTYRRRHVIVKDFTSLYRLAHEYYSWTRSDDYIEADRDFADLIQADEYLIKKLRRFNNYRRVLMTRVPGPKPIEREEHRWYAEFEEDLTISQQDVEDVEGNTTDSIRPKYFPKELLEQFPKHSVDRITSKDPKEPTNGDSDSSGSAAGTKGTVLECSTGTYSHIAHGTIRSTKEDTNGTEETDAIEANQTSNPPVTEKEMAGAAHAKEVERASDSKKLTPFERTALQAGVPIELVDEMQMWYEAYPRPEKHPMFLEGIVSTFSQEMGNMAYLQSNLTQVTKLFRYAEHKGFTEDDFRAWLYDAEKRTHRDGISNKMAYFFTALKVELLLAIAGSQWPQPPEPSMHSIGDVQPIVDDRAENEIASEEPQEAQHDGFSDVREELSTSAHTEASVSSERVPVSLYPVLACDDPTLGWTQETAVWWADRLRDRLGKDQYGYEIQVTEHRKWGFVFFARQHPAAREAFLIGKVVEQCVRHGWQPPQEEQS